MDEENQLQKSLPAAVVASKSSKQPKNMAVYALSVLALLLGAVALYVGMTGMGSEKKIKDLRQVTEDQKQQIEDLERKIGEVELQKGFSVDSKVNKDGYQAVFLNESTVYFGKLSDGLPGQVKLEDIYYLRGGEYGVEGDILPSGDVSLAKLGDELHGPEDVMHISRDSVQFWENLKENSEVVKAIREHKAQQ